MGDRTWPTGIRGHGSGIQIRLWRHGQEIPIQVPGNPNSPRDLASAVRRREERVARLKLGLPIHTGDELATLSLFKDAAQDYLNDLDAAYSTHINYEAHLNCYWLPAFGNWPVTDINRRAIKKVLGSRNLALTTKRSILSPLRGVLDYAEVDNNPARGLKIGRGRDMDKVKRYSPEERQALLDGLEGQPRVFFSLMFGCGLRPGENLALRWEDYDGESLVVERTISKRQLKTSTKTYHRRKVYVPSWVRPALNDHYTRPRQGWIFLTRATRPYKSPEILNDAWRAAHLAAGIPPRVPYVCRHTRASELLSQGVNPGDAAKQLGHGLKTFIGIYAEWIDEFSEDRDLSRFEGVQVNTSDWKPASDRPKSESGKAKVLKFKEKKA